MKIVKKKEKRNEFKIKKLKRKKMKHKIHKNISKIYSIYTPKRNKQVILMKKGSCTFLPLLTIVYARFSHIPI